MNILRSSLALSAILVVLANIEPSRRPFARSERLTRSIEHPVRQALHRKRSDGLYTEIYCPIGEPGFPPLIGYLENCLWSVSSFQPMRVSCDFWSTPIVVNFETRSESSSQNVLAGLPKAWLPLEIMFPSMGVATAGSVLISSSCTKYCKY